MGGHRFAKHNITIEFELKGIDLDAYINGVPPSHTPALAVAIAATAVTVAVAAATTIAATTTTATTAAAAAAVSSTASFAYS